MTPPVHFNPLGSIRRAQGFSRGVTILVVLALLALVAERSIYYLLLDNDAIEAQDPVATLQQRAPHLARQMEQDSSPNAPKTTPSKTPAASPSPTAQLGDTVQALHTALGTLNTQLKQSAATSDTEQQLQQLQTRLHTLDQQIIADFNEIDQHIKIKQLPDSIQQRQQAAVAIYQHAYNDLIAQLNNITTETDTQRKQHSIQTLKKTLASYQFKRSQQPFDPEQLPNRSLKPKLDNTPKLQEEDFTRAGLHNSPHIQLAALGDFTFDKLAGASDPAYLAATPEVSLSQSIKDQAQTLNYDPVTIYHWVRNNIEWQPTWGAMQNADLTLSSGRGNSFDIASLTIALLRASQIPARYVHGTIDIPEANFRNWAGGFANINAATDFAASGGIPTTSVTRGGQITKVRIEHIWVEAAIDYQPSRGAKNRDADSWIAMDPSYKQYDYLSGLDAVQISGLDPEQLATDFTNSGTVNESEGWVTGFDPTILQNAQTQTQTALNDYITNNLTDPTVGDVIGGRKTIIKQYPVLPSSLPNRIVVTGSRYGALPSQLQHHMAFAFQKDILGDLIDPISYPYAQLNNQKVTLSFRPATPDDEAALQSLLPEGEITDISQLPSSIPAYLISVIPELTINGQVIKQGSPMRLGEDLSFNFRITYQGHGTFPYEYKVPAGSYLSVAVVGGSVSPQILTDLQAKVTETKTILETNDASLISSLTREDLLGDLFYAGTLGYYAQYTALARLVGQQQNAQHYLAAGYGTFGYEPNVDYFFGVPRAITTGGAVMNIPILNITATDSPPDTAAEDKKNYLLQIGILSSALEHAVPEQLFSADPTNPPDAISAVKALSKANAQGQRIYHITPANQGTALPNIHHDLDIMAEIRNALNVGKEVITHTDAVTVPGWSGAGYIIIDPQTGDGAYKISGGLNGGFLSTIEDKLFQLIGLLKDILNSFVDNFGGVIAKTITAAISSIEAVITFITLVKSNKCPLTVAVAGILSIAVFSGQVSVVIGAASAAASAFLTPAGGAIVGMLLGIGAASIAGQIAKSFSQRCS